VHVIKPHFVRFFLCWGILLIAAYITHPRLHVDLAYRDHADGIEPERAGLDRSVDRILWLNHINPQRHHVMDQFQELPFLYALLYGKADIAKQQ